MHLGVLEPPPWPEDLGRLWDSWPGLTLGYAIPRRDAWRRLVSGERPASPGMLRGLPPDPGVAAYLRQLDLDLLLLGETGGPGSTEADYLIACRRLGLPAAAIGPSPEATLAQAAPGATAPPPPDPAGALGRPLLWLALGCDLLNRPPEGDGGEGEAPAGDLGARIREGYARRVFPALAAAAASLAPARRPLLRQDLKRRLDRGDLANDISAEGAMAAAAEGKGPVVLGPWWGDPELEILYWTPFLRWWRRRYQVDKDRLVAVSSGGAAPWYDNLLGQYLDVSELYEPAALADLEDSRREELAARKKRFGVTEADRQVLKRLDRRLGFRGLKVLPPWVMAVAFERYWSGEAGPALLAARARSQPLRIKEKLARKRFPDLPAAYVCFGAPEGELDGLEHALWRTAERARVVVLAEPGSAAWAEAMAARRPRIRTIVLEPAAAKGVGSLVLAAAQAYVGPRGWMAYAAAALGRPAVCLGGQGDERGLIDQAAAARLFAPSPLLLDAGDVEAMAGALELIAASPMRVEAVH